MDEAGGCKAGDAAASETSLRETQHRWVGTISEGDMQGGSRILCPQFIISVVASHWPLGVFKMLAGILFNSFQATLTFLLED